MNENKTSKEFMDKIIINSYYPPFSSNVVVFYNESIRNEITEKGKEYINLMKRKL